MQLPGLATMLSYAQDFFKYLLSRKKIPFPSQSTRTHKIKRVKKAVNGTLKYLKKVIT